MSGEVTTVRVTSGDSTIISVASGESTVLNVSNSASSILVATPATISMPTYVNLSDDIPQELANVGSAGVSLFAARADHVHPTTGALFNGGNF